MSCCLSFGTDCRPVCDPVTSAFNGLSGKQGRKQDYANQIVSSFIHMQVPRKDTHSHTCSLRLTGTHI